MSIFAEEIEKAIAFLPGLFKFEEDGLFSQAVLALTPECLLIYNDNAPDEVSGEDWTYKVKDTIPFNMIEMVTHESIESKRNSKDIKSRLIVKIKGEEAGKYRFYYQNDKRSFAVNFMAGLKHYAIKTKNIKTRLSY